MTFQTPNPKKSYIIISIIIILITITVVVYILYANRETLINFDWKLRPEFILLSFFLFCINLGLMITVWASIMVTIGTQIEIQRHFFYYTLSNVTKRLPGTIWYLFSRAYFYHQDGVSIKLISLASLMEISGTLTSGVIISFLFIASLSQKIYYSLLGVIILSCVIIIHPKIFRPIINSCYAPE